MGCFDRIFLLCFTFLFASFLLTLPAHGRDQPASQELNLPERIPSVPASSPVESFHILNVRDFGALGDGKKKDTDAISHAILAANHNGGGKVVFPPGIYLTGTFELLSNVELNFQAGAILMGSPDFDDYGDISQFGFDHNYGVSSSGEGERVGIIVARNADNIALTGQGAIDGNSQSFFDFSVPHVSRDFDARFTRNPAGFTSATASLENGPVEVKQSGRPGTLIILSSCRNVVIRDITLQNAPNWTLHLQATEDAIISGLRIKNDLRVPNNDGMDCMRCRNVHISDCNISAGDDDFAFVSSDNVSASNCSLRSNSSGIRLEDTRDSTFHDLVIHANRGLGIYDRGHGNTANVLFSNLVIDSHLLTGHWWGKGEPILIASSGDAGNGGVHDLKFTNISATGQSGMVLYGTHAGAIRHIRFAGISLKIEPPSLGLASSMGGNFDLRWVATNLSNAVFRHDIAALYGYNVNDLGLRDFEITWSDGLPDYFTSGIELENFSTINIDGFSGRQALKKSNNPVIVLRHGTGFSIRNSTAKPGTGTFLSTTEVTGTDLLMNNDFSEAVRAFKLPGRGITAQGNHLPIKGRLGKSSSVSASARVNQAQHAPR